MTLELDKVFISARAETNMSDFYLIFNCINNLKKDDEVGGSGCRIT